MRRAYYISNASSLALVALLLAGCAVGPDFASPGGPNVSAYDSKPIPEKTADGAQNIDHGGDIPAEWWALFHSDNLNKLIEQAIRDNPDLASAEATLKVAEDNLSAGGAAFFPVVGGSFNSERQQTSKAANGTQSVYTLHTASVAVSYNLDLWGGTRREVEALEAQAGAARFQKEAAYLSLTSNAVTLAISEANLRAQIAAAKEIIAAQEKTMEVVNLRFTSGAVAKNAVAAQQSALAAARANLQPLEHQLAVTRHALSALIGQTPSNEFGAEFNLSDITLPARIPLSLPSKLVAQRPDIRAAEENLHAASAAIGVAVAARLPNITLSADVGTMANTFKKLLTPGFGLWSVGATAAQTLFDAGALASKEKSARDAYDAAAAQYRKTVLAAFQNVADTLHALQSDALSLNAKRDAEKAASDNLAVAQSQFAAGAVGIAELLAAKQSAAQAKAAATQALAQRYADTAALFAALGGGWWNRGMKTAAEETNIVKPYYGEGPQ
jgi:NodT family efflux transporter outer membrane factor (OMF) lipoprotein